MPRHLILSLTSPARSHKADVQLGILLAFIAGAVNAGGFLAVGFYISHMSGIAASIGDALVTDQWKTAIWAGAFLGSFMAGALTCSVIIQLALVHKLNTVFALPLLLEALLLLGFASAMVGDAHGPIGMKTGWIVSLLCFIMGLQNAMITNISNAVIRTTHITGVATDVGIETGRFLASKIIRQKQIDFKAGKLFTHLSLIMSFVMGGIIGAFGFLHVGFVMIIPLAMVLGVLAGVPIIDHWFAKKQA